MQPQEPLLLVPDTLGSKRSHPILAQPPDKLLDFRLKEPERIAAGVEAVLDTLEFNWGEAGVGRGTRALVKLN